ncbi:MAG: hypothetical protein JXP48_01080 [Acidobacteria bacterium]|nr:hypothetical protein [Acidobacteriota bacterium]
MAVAGSPAARRVIALLILAVTLLLAVSSWGPYRALLERYRTHAGQ